MNILYSLSRKAFREEKLEEMDERNRFIKLKAQSRAYIVCQFVHLCGAVALYGLGKAAHSAPQTYLGLGLLAAFIVALLADFLTWAYYDEYI